MLATRSPLTEKMTLFWHNHFASSHAEGALPAADVPAERAAAARTRWATSATLLHAVARDPAMLIYLDSASNRKGQPNENFAREVMELFTLGEGHYTEADIKEAARAFTGWSIDPDTGDSCSAGRAHDDGEKTFLGRTGNFDGDDVLDILLAQPQTAEFIVAKLWREFVSPQPDPAEVKRLAARLPRVGLRDQGGAARAARLRRLLRAGEPRGADQVPGRARRRHAAPVRSSAPAKPMPFVLHREPARPDAVRAAQRQGLARRRGLDQLDHAARAQGVPERLFRVEELTPPMAAA